MQYVQYHKEIVMRYSIALRGWTYPTFTNPSELSTSLPPLQELLDAIKSGKCKFVKLTAEERQAEDEKYNEKIQSGEVVVKVRATRKDKGKKRKARVTSDDEETDGETRSQPAKRRRARKAPKAAQKSAEIVNSDSDD
jgi:hypothetical protein